MCPPSCIRVRTFENTQATRSSTRVTVEEGRLRSLFIQFTNERTPRLRSLFIQFANERTPRGE